MLYPESQVNPVFSPDNRSIAFGQVSRRNRGAIRTIRTDGADQRHVTGTGLEYPDPDYSPHGRSLVFVGQVPGARPYESALCTVRASGSARRLLTGSFEDPGLAREAVVTGWRWLSC